MAFPQSHRHHCPACGWSKTTIYASDVLLPGGTYFAKCPQCGHAPLTSTALPRDTSSVPQIVTDILKKWLHR